MKFGFVLFLFQLFIVESLSEMLTLVGPDHPLIAEAGRDLVLPCSLESKVDNVSLEVTWSKSGAETREILHYSIHLEHNSTHRATLFRDELRTGNASLKLSSVQLSDEGTYKCFVKSGKLYNHITVDVEVVGAQPVIMIDYHSDRKLRLSCEAKGWKHTSEMQWLDSERSILPTDDTDTPPSTRDVHVKRVIIENKRNNRLFCKIQHDALIKEAEIWISSKLFNEQPNSRTCTCPWTWAWTLTVLFGTGFLLTFPLSCFLCMTGLKRKWDSRTAQRDRRLEEDRRMQEERRKQEARMIEESIRKQQERLLQEEEAVKEEPEKEKKHSVELAKSPDSICSKLIQSDYLDKEDM